MTRWLGTVLTALLLALAAAPAPAPASVTPAAGTVDRVVPERAAPRVVTFRFETRGRMHTSVSTFRRQVRETFADPRGWRRTGVAFREVRRGADLVVVLAEAGTVPSFSSACSAYWSCRVGRYVIINQARWRFATPPWNRAGMTRRDYRHLVVNHETGHWLGRGHRGCPAPGRPAPVMMTQSKGLDGCRFNSWPTRAEVG